MEKSLGVKLDTKMSDDITVGQLINILSFSLRPILIESVSKAVSNAVTSAMSNVYKTVLQNVKLDLAQQTETLNNVKVATQKQSFDMDRLEQYSRKENIRVHGIPEVPGENTSRILVELARDIGVEMSETDISVSHRLPGKARPNGNPGNPPRPRVIIAKFVRRDTKNTIMRNKKKLKELQNTRKEVYIEDDLTPLRSRLIREIKKDTSVKTCWSIDGRIVCIVNERGQEVKKFIDSPADLEPKLGWSKEKVIELGFLLKL